MSSKKKIRYKKYLERQAKREVIKQKLEALREAKSLEQIAKALEIRIK